MHPPSPINVPNVISNHAGWPINDKGVFYIQELDLRPPLNNAGPNHVDSVLNMLLSRHYIEEIVSDSIDHSLQGDFVVAKLNHPYTSSYYYAAFDIYFIPSMNPVPANFDDAIAPCQSVGDDETLRSFPNSYSSFSPYTKRYIKCFVWPIPPPIPSKIPLPFPLSQKQSGWLVNRDSNISLNPLNSEKWMDEMRKWASQSSLVMECINARHWEANALDKGKYSDDLWPWLDDDNVKPAGPLYPPGAIHFFVLAKVEAIGCEGGFIRARNDHPFYYPDVDAPLPDEERGLVPEESGTATCHPRSSTVEQGPSRAVKVCSLDTIPPPPTFDTS